MKIKAAVGIAILCIGFLLFGMFVPISTETEEYLLQDLPEQYMDTKQEWEEMQSAFSLYKWMEQDNRYSICQYDKNSLWKKLHGCTHTIFVL